MRISVRERNTRDCVCRVVRKVGGWLFADMNVSNICMCMQTRPVYAHNALSLYAGMDDARG